MKKIIDFEFVTISQSVNRPPQLEKRVEIKGVSFSETGVWNRWGSEIQRFGFNCIDKEEIATVRK